MRTPGRLFSVYFSTRLSACLAPPSPSRVSYRVRPRGSQAVTVRRPRWAREGERCPHPEPPLPGWDQNPQGAPESSYAQKVMENRVDPECIFWEESRLPSDSESPSRRKGKTPHQEKGLEVGPVGRSSGSPAGVRLLLWAHSLPEASVTKDSGSGWVSEQWWGPPLP